MEAELVKDRKLRKIPLARREWEIEVGHTDWGSRVEETKFIHLWEAGLLNAWIVQMLLVRFSCLAPAINGHVQMGHIHCTLLRRLGGQVIRCLASVRIYL